MSTCMYCSAVYVQSNSVPVAQAKEHHLAARGDGQSNLHADPRSGRDVLEVGPRAVTVGGDAWHDEHR